MQNVWNQAGFVLKIVRRFHVSPGDAVDNHPGAHVAFGFSKMGFMRTSGRMPAASACTTCARLMNSPPAWCSEGGHVLAFEGRHPVAILFKYPAQPCAQQAFPGGGHGALNHNGFSHTAPP